MALNNQDLMELLTYTRKLMRAQGLAALDEQIMHIYPPDRTRPLDDLIKYLKSVADQARFGSKEEYGKTLMLLNEFVRTEDGARISGVDLHLSEAEAERYETKIVNLEGAPMELDGVFQEFVEVIDLIYASLDHGEPENEI